MSKLQINYNDIEKKIISLLHYFNITSNISYYEGLNKISYFYDIKCINKEQLKEIIHKYSNIYSNKYFKCSNNYHYICTFCLNKSICNDNNCFIQHIFNECYCIKYLLFYYDVKSILNANKYVKIGYIKQIKSSHLQATLISNIIPNKCCIDYSNIDSFNINKISFVKFINTFDSFWKLIELQKLYCYNIYDKFNCYNRLQQSYCFNLKLKRKNKTLFEENNKKYISKKQLIKKYNGIQLNNVTFDHIFSNIKKQSLIIIHLYYNKKLNKITTEYNKKPNCFISILINYALKYETKNIVQINGNSRRYNLKICLITDKININNNSITYLSKYIYLFEQKIKNYMYQYNLKNTINNHCRLMTTSSSFSNDIKSQIIQLKNNILLKKNYIQITFGLYPNSLIEFNGNKLLNNIIYNLFNEKEIIQLEKFVVQLDQKYKFSNDTKEIKISKNNKKIVRTKFYYGGRYNYNNDKSFNFNVNSIYSKEIIDILSFIKNKLQILNKFNGFNYNLEFDQINFNIYRGCGLDSHFDSNKLFEYPIILIRIFSDSYLSYGVKYYGTSNGIAQTFFPRGSVMIFEKNCYGSIKIPHSIRNIDVIDISGVIVLRKKKKIYK